MKKQLFIPSLKISLNREIIVFHHDEHRLVLLRPLTQLMKRLIFRFQKLVFFRSQLIETFEYVTTTQPADRRMVDLIPVPSIKLG